MVGIFVRRRLPWVEGRVAGRVDRDDRADVVQDVFHSVFASAHRITGSHPGEFTNWLKAITRNRIADHTARRKRQADNELEADAPAFGEEDGAAREIADLNDQFGAVDAVDLVERALETRSQAHRRAIELRMDGYRSREVAEILAAEDLPMTPGNVDQVFSRFRRELKAGLDGTR